jgi:hypothetical protein
MSKLRISGDSSGYIDLEAPNAASSSTLDLDQVPQKNAATTGFTGNVGVGISTPSTTAGGYDGGNLHVHNSGTGSSIRLTNNTTGTGTSSGMLISKWSDSNTYLTNFDDGANTIFTQSNSSGTLQTTIKLDGDGYVTTPAQPSFHAYPSAGFTGYGAGVYIPFPCNNASHNIGNHYDTSTYTFTAPVAGTYQFNASPRFDGVVGGYHVARFYKNGGTLSGSYWIDQASGDYNTISVGLCILLAANDTIQVKLLASSDGSWNVSSQSSISGYLLG